MRFNPEKDKYETEIEYKKKDILKRNDQIGNYFYYYYYLIFLFIDIIV